MDNMDNYRPISNLTFLSKIIEKVVASQLQFYLDINGLFEPFQSGFCSSYSTETALLRVVKGMVHSEINFSNVLAYLKCLCFHKHFQF